MDQIVIDVKGLYSNFEFHLKNNKRVLFSGVFGIGKTYFLKKYFEDNKNRYNTFHLFPVNYQVSQNEDIFELIKVDVLYSMLGQGWLFANGSEEKIGKTLAAQAYTINKASGAFQAILKILSLGKSKNAVEGVTELESIISGFTGYYKKLSESKNDLETIKAYRDTFESKKGSIYEMDSMTHLISELLEENSSKNESQEQVRKESVLIIDDLDRIDPEHVFRILNVFSAHFDIDDEDNNKFGFDKVIFVCDINNIRNIFSAKYGVKTDFNGYINKFFSSHIYYFDNKEEIKKTIKKYVEEVFRQKNVQKYYSEIEVDLCEFLFIFIQSDKISLRQLKNLRAFDYYADFPKHTEIFRHHYWYLINLLLAIFNNDIYKLEDAFSNFTLDPNVANEFLYRKENYLQFLILLNGLDYRKITTELTIDKGAYKIYKNAALDIKIKYKVVNTGRYYFADIEDVGLHSSADLKRSPTGGVRYFTRDVTLDDIFKLFLDAIEQLNKNGLLITDLKTNY